jgi:hypothetical protein
MWNIGNVIGGNILLIFLKAPGETIVEPNTDGVVKYY